MERFRSFDGVELAFAVEGDGPAVLLLHGFAADHAVSWVRTGVAAALVAAGFTVVMPDARGHGASGKPHDAVAYGDDAMAKDARALLDRLELADVAVVGYSMGALTASRLVPDDSRVRALVLGGIGGRRATVRAAFDSEAIAAGLTTAEPRSIGDTVARAFRRFADRNGADRFALAALQRAPRPGAPARWGYIAVPTLLLVGEDDTLAARADELAARIRGARTVVVPGDHLRAPYAPAFRRALVEFLSAHRT